MSWKCSILLDNWSIMNLDNRLPFLTSIHFPNYYHKYQSGYTSSIQAIPSLHHSLICMYMVAIFRG